MIPIKENTKRGSLILRNSKIAIVGRVSINSDQINLTLFGKSHQLHFSYAEFKVYLVWYNYTITMQHLYQEGKRIMISKCVKIEF